MTKFLSRALLICFFVLTLPTIHSLASPSEARVQLEKTVDAVLDELQKPELRDPAKRGAVMADVEKLILHLFDFGELSTRTVGPNWKQFTPDQKQRFTDAFTTLLRETYLEKLYGYSGETVTYNGETSSTDGSKVEIHTAVVVKGKQVPVAYRMLKKEHWIVYDVIIEGVSMVQNYRSQFQDIMSKGDAEKLIKLVQDRAESVRAHNRAQQSGK